MGRSYLDQRDLDRNVHEFESVAGEVIGGSQVSGGAGGSPTAEDALDFLVDLMRDQPRTVAAYGYDVWTRNVADSFVRQFVRGTVGPQFEVAPATQSVSRAFMDAAWQLCRLGVLRPGTIEIDVQSHGDGEGYTITEFGRTWLAEHTKPAYVPTDAGRIASLLTRRPDLFGDVYVARATDAARCYSAHAYYACCAMIGAAAESIMLTAGIAKLTEPVALKLYRGTAGRKALTDAVLKGCPDYVAREFRLHADLIGLWRDQSAHAYQSPIGEAEAFVNMRGLIKFAHFAEDRWQHLTAKSA
jgi:hypothetical protein